MAVLSLPRSGRRRLQFSLAAFLIAVALAGYLTHLAMLHFAARTARYDFERAQAGFEAEVITREQLTHAADALHAAELAVPWASSTAAYTEHVTRAAKFRRQRECLICELGRDLDTAHREDLFVQRYYHQAVGNLARVAGYEYAKAIDASFEFPSRDVEDYRDADFLGPPP